jgi:hypothetical protein
MCASYAKNNPETGAVSDRLAAMIAERLRTTHPQLIELLNRDYRCTSKTRNRRIDLLVYFYHSQECRQWPSRTG